MITIARNEFIMLFRNRLVAVSAVVVPVVFAVLLVWKRDNFGGAGAAATLQIITMSALGVYITATTTLAARRQNNFLKKLRTTTASPWDILGGILLPLAVLNVVQLAVIVGVLAAIDQPPANAALVVLGVVGVEALFIAFALATSCYTNSPEHAQVTTMPLFFVAFGVAFWIVLTGTGEHEMIKRILPGGGTAELILAGWNGADTIEAIRMIGATVMWICVAAIYARKGFRWESRA
ncbi:ABC transporter permease [Corynebacterium aquilae]|uniref:ABC transporter permease n=1 Tax=Corynebacterium aquilae DSM 44791 TaxID=1431546 RepID=A0A1L7CI71_9CORY|nr:ABC transporter permease [Corynebacterium aquilae]APT85463.1 ABC transporter permease [Corynebacterium aquilae DSM 44791]